MIKDVRANLKKDGYRIHMEVFNSADDVVKANGTRSITNSNFQNVRTKSYGDFQGVKDYAEAEELMRTGYQPTVDAMRGVWKQSRSGEVMRFKFKNDIVGFAPVVPLAMKGVPNCMINMRMTPIKAKVLDVYYDITSSCGTDSDDIIKVGQSILGAIVELEQAGYRFNLYGVQSYSGSDDCDMLVVKLKSASQPLDLRRVSFPLTHTAFFRVIGFDWYSRVPGGTHRLGYGHALGYDYGDKQLNDMARQIFGKNAVYLTAAHILHKTSDEIKEAIKDVSKN